MRPGLNGTGTPAAPAPEPPAGGGPAPLPARPDDVGTVPAEGPAPFREDPSRAAPPAEEAEPVHISPHPAYVPRRTSLFTRILRVVLVALALWLPIELHGLCWVSLLIGLGAVLLLLLIFRLRARTVVALMAALVLVEGVGLEIWNGAAFHTASLSGPPPALLWCGRTYWPPGHTLRAETPAQLRGLRPAVVAGRLQTVGTTPSGLPILSPTACGGTNPPSVFLPAGPHTYYRYALSRPN
ncbi:MAG TPA: hypothetical protein VK277_04140 [Acidimicrobiales bacterium]|nr:hypothetical protein [Acidimicrobiales bacterium]